jgi:hypothetical protein
VAKDDQSGVRGPRGPQRQSPKTAPGSRGALERISYPLLTALLRVPRWLVVVLLATAFTLGLIQTGDLAWLGGVLLGLVALFLGWLLALAWPVLTPGRRTIRLVTVVAALGVAILKFQGRF